MSRSGFKIRLAAITLTLLLGSSWSRAQVPINGFQVENNGTKVQVFSGEFETESEIKDVADGISSEIEKTKIAHPSADFRVDTAVINGGTGKNLIERLEQRLRTADIETSESASVELPPAHSKILNAFLKTKKWNYIVLKVSAVFGLEYFMVMTGQGSASLYLEAATAAAGAALITSLATVQLGKAQNNWRIYKIPGLVGETKVGKKLVVGVKSVSEFYQGFKSNLKVLLNIEDSPRSEENATQEESWFNQKLSSAGKYISVHKDRAHMMTNYWITEYLFGAAIRNLQAYVYHLNHIAYQEASEGKFLWNVTISTYSQGEWDRGVFRYREYLRKTGVPERVQKIVYFGLATVGSIASIGGFTFLNLNLGLGSTATGYAFLGALRYGGVKMNKIIDKKTAALISDSASRIDCDITMSGALVPN